MSGQVFNLIRTELAGKYNRIPVFFVEVIPRHDRLVFFSQIHCKLRVALEANPKWLAAFLDKREHLPFLFWSDFIHRDILAKREIEPGALKT